MLKREGVYGLAEVYVCYRSKGYTRSAESVCLQICKGGIRSRRYRRKEITSMSEWMENNPGDKVQIDIKYAPDGCIKFSCYADRYYPIAAIDECSRKRVFKMVKEKSTYETAKYIRDLEEKMGFPIKTVQVDNGTEFVNDTEVTGKTSAFEAAVKDLGMNLRRTRPYSL